MTKGSGARAARPTAGPAVRAPVRESVRGAVLAVTCAVAWTVTLAGCSEHSAAPVDPPRGLHETAAVAADGSAAAPAVRPASGGSGSRRGSAAARGSATAASGVAWPADVPFPSGTVLAHAADPTDWSASLLVPGFQPDVRTSMTSLYTGAGFALVSDGLPQLLTRSRYTLRVQVSPRDHREDESYVTLQLSRA